MTPTEETPPTNEIYIERALKHLGTSREMSRLVQGPYREVKVELPVRHSDGSLSVLHGGVVVVAGWKMRRAVKER